MFKKGQTVVVMPRSGIVQAGSRQLMSGDTATVAKVHGSLVTVQKGSNRVTLSENEVRAA